MTPERWRQVEDLFHAVRELPPGERDAYLGRACAGDIALQQEVQSLLAGREGTLLAGGIASAAARVLPAHGSREGSTIGVYQLGPVIGVGGMGEVYRARDTRLGRDVAVKILPPAFTDQADRLARFEREARVLATLNHSNIAAIYGLEEGPGVRALVLELVEGVTLAEKLRDETGAPRALSVQDSLAIAIQIARGCEAAHHKGVIHRDLKPANIKIAPDGTVKILDFGIAKVERSGDPGSPGFGVLTTGEGAVLGTVAYMSPEQARGQLVDRRTDIWAFGCILYEMLTGSRSFPGDTSADVFGAITSRDPDWTLLPADTPERVRTVLRRCLARDAEQRYRDIADVRLELQEAIERRQAGQPEETASSRRHLMLLPWIAAAAIAAIAFAYVWLRPSDDGPQRRGPARVSIELPAEVAVYAIGRGSSVAVAPDGKRIVYVAVAGDSTRLMSRPLDGLESVPVAGTEGGTNPFFSPDGRWIAFWSRGTLKRVPAEGGTATTIADNASYLGAAWGDDGTIVYVSNPGGELWRVPVAGGTPSRVTTRARAGDIHSWPQLLLDGRAILYTVWNNTGFDGGRIVVQPLEGGSPTVIVEKASYGRVVTLGGGRSCLVYARPDGVMAARFDPQNNRLLGDAVPAQAGVLTNLSGGAHFSYSADGVLAYVPGELYEQDKTLLWVDRGGNATELPPIQGVGFQYRLSPDGQRLVRPNAAGANRDLWVDDLTGRGASIRLTFDEVINSPIWTPDGRRVIYTGGDGNLYWRAADGSGQHERLTTSPNQQQPSSVSPDGTVVYMEFDRETGIDLWRLSLHGTREPRRLLSTPRNEGAARTSPDGRWIAYQSNISGSVEVYLASFPDVGRRLQVSQGGGFVPMWSPDGRELYYRTAPPDQGGGRMMAVTVDTTGAELKLGTSRVLFPGPFQGNGDVAPDGRFLLMRQTTRESSTRVIQLVFDWFDDLQKKLPPS